MVREPRALETLRLDRQRVSVFKTAQAEPAKANRQRELHFGCGRQSIRKMQLLAKGV